MHQSGRTQRSTFTWRQRALLRELQELEELHVALAKAQRQIDSWADRFRESWSADADALVVVTPTHLVAAPSASALRCRAVGIDGGRCREPVWSVAAASRTAAAGAVLFSADHGRAAEGLCRQLCGFHLDRDTVVTVAAPETVVIPRAALGAGHLEVVLRVPGAVQRAPLTSVGGRHRSSRAGDGSPA